MHRFFLPPGQCHGDELVLSGKEAHHATQVVRLRPHEAVMIHDGEGTLLHCETASLERRRIRLRVLSRTSIPRPVPALVLIQALPKGKLFDWVVQKATELGADAIIPLTADRSVPRFRETEAGAKVERWRHVAVEAMKQCGTAWLPRVAPVTSFDAAVADIHPGELHLVAALDPRSRHPRLVFDEAEARAGSLPRRIAWWIGPEGDFTPCELTALLEQGVVLVTLGGRILRCETAALYALAVSGYELAHRPNRLSPKPPVAWQQNTPK